MRTGDDDPDIRIIVLTIIRLRHSDAALFSVKQRAMIDRSLRYPMPQLTGPCPN